MKKRTAKKVVVVGGAGFIGSHVVDALVEKGYNVHVVDNLSGGTKKNINPLATFHKADIRKPAALPKIFAGAHWVFHLAALPRVPYSIDYPQETNDVNVTGMLNVLVAAKNAKVAKVIYSASSSAYGDQPIMPLVEDMTAAPKSPYGLQKYIGELYCRVFSVVYGLPTVSLRYFNVYGSRFNAEGAYALVIGTFLKQRLVGKPMTITGDGKQTRDFTHVSDVVRANMLAAEKADVGNPVNDRGGEVFNIGAGKNVSISRIAELIGGPVAHIPARLEPHDSLADNSRARKLLGWKPAMSIEQGIALLKKEILGTV
jgi:UDP-glucose 4-epimerase